MRILLIDNYDSFTFNLLHYIEPMVSEVVVCRNDRIKIEDVASFDKIIFSPGPELPQNAGLMLEIMREYWKLKPMLGVCLGFQAMMEVAGGELINLVPVRHGQQHTISVNNNSILFKDFSDTTQVGLYHSWGIDKVKVPPEFEVVSQDDSGIAMAAEHKSLPLMGVQFHPESVMTPQGKQMLKNWVNS